MKYRRVLYTDRLTESIRNKLRIIKYDKIKSKNNNVYFVFFASEEDAEYAQKACKRIPNITIKPFQSKSTITTTVPLKETTVTTTVPSKETKTATTTSQPKIKLIARHLAPNSLEIQQLLESIDCCFNAMTIVKCTLDEVGQLPHDKYQQHEPLFNRLYTEHSTALYMKMTLATQLKTMFSTNLRLPWSTIDSHVKTLERHVSHEQTSMKNLSINRSDSLKRLNFQSSITMSSKLAYELVKLTDP